MVPAALRATRKREIRWPGLAGFVTLGGMSLWPVQPFDPATASDGDLAGVHALEVALETEALPDEPVAPLEHTVARLRHVYPFRVGKAGTVARGGPHGWSAPSPSCSSRTVP